MLSRVDLSPAAFELIGLAGQVLPVAGGRRQLRRFGQQIGEVAQAGDERCRRLIEQGDVLAGAAEQVGSLDLLERHVALTPFGSEPLVSRGERSLDAGATQEQLSDLLDVVGLVAGRGFGGELAIGPEAIGDLDPARLVLVGGGFDFTNAMTLKLLQVGGDRAGTLAEPTEPDRIGGSVAGRCGARRRAVSVCRELLDNVARLHILDLPEEVKDITDWFAAGHSEVELIERLEATPHAV